MNEVPETIRAFVAVRMGDEVEAALAAFIDELRSPHDGVKWVRRSNLHVTIKFLGPAVEMMRLLPLRYALQAIADETEAFKVRSRGAGAFPDLRRPRVIWAGLESSELDALARNVEAAAERCGFDRESRSWSGHLTIGRVRSLHGFGRTRSALETARERDFGVSRIEEMTLYRSILDPAGSIHEPLATFTFRPQR